ncbi:MAG: hypothetical protein ACJ77A_11175 [Actinomycetota bacterium]
MICNGCGEEKPTSWEHLIHLVIGRVLLKDHGVAPTELRPRLRTHPWYKELDLWEHDPVEGEPVRKVNLADAKIRNLLCRDCNGSWARRLEEQGGERLYQFIHLHRPADAPVMRRWVMFFAMKLWWTERRTEALRHGDLHQVFDVLRRSGSSIETSIRVARLRASRDRWRFAFVRRGRVPGGTDSIVFIFWGVVFVVP